MTDPVMEGAAEPTTLEEIKIGKKKSRESALDRGLEASRDSGDIDNNGGDGARKRGRGSFGTHSPSDPFDRPFTPRDGNRRFSEGGGRGRDRGKDDRGRKSEGGGGGFLPSNVMGRPSKV